MLLILLSTNFIAVITGALSGSNFSGPVCLGDVLIFECTVTRGGSTVWNGTAFDCSNSNDEIALLHNRFSNSSYYIIICNNGDVTGQGLYVEHDQYYTSQLNVTINPALIGKNIICAHDNGTVSQVVGFHALNFNDLTCSNYSDVGDKGS